MIMEGATTEQGWVEQVRDNRVRTSRGTFLKTRAGKYLRYNREGSNWITILSMEGLPDFIVQNYGIYDYEGNEPQIDVGYEDVGSVGGRVNKMRVLPRFMSYEIQVPRSRQRYVSETLHAFLDGIKYDKKTLYCHIYRNGFDCYNTCVVSDIKNTGDQNEFRYKKYSFELIFEDPYFRVPNRTLTFETHVENLFSFPFVNKDVRFGDAVLKQERIQIVDDMSSTSMDYQVECIIVIASISKFIFKNDLTNEIIELETTFSYGDKIFIDTLKNKIEITRFLTGDVENGIKYLSRRSSIFKLRPRIRNSVSLFQDDYISHSVFAFWAINWESRIWHV